MVLVELIEDLKCVSQGQIRWMEMEASEEVVCNAAKFDINLIPSKYRVCIADTNTDTFYFLMW